MRRLKRLLAKLILSGLVGLGYIIFYLFSQATQLFVGIEFINILLFFILVALVVLFTKLLLTYLDAIKTNKQLRNHNLYNLGAATSLFNFDLLESSVKHAYKHEGKGKPATPQSVTLLCKSNSARKFFISFVR